MTLESYLISMNQELNGLMELMKLHHSTMTISNFKKWYDQNKSLEKYMGYMSDGVTAIPINDRPIAFAETVRKYYEVIDLYNHLTQETSVNS